MDRTSTHIAVLLACIVLFQGCDFLRGVAGRPLSGEIAAKRDALESARIADSLKVAAEREAAQAAARHAADSVSALQFFADKAVALKSSSEVRGVSFAGYDSRYCIILGVFSSEENAAKLAARVESLGVAPVTFRYTNGKSLVGACPTDDIVEVRAAYERLSSEPFFPSEAWIMLNPSAL